MGDVFAWTPWIINKNTSVTQVQPSPVGGLSISGAGGTYSTSGCYVLFTVKQSSTVTITGGTTENFEVLIVGGGGGGGKDRKSVV